MGSPVPISLNTISLYPFPHPLSLDILLSRKIHVIQAARNFDSLLILFPDGSIRGFAYIEFESADDAAEAIFNMNDSELYNRVIKVDIAKPHRGVGGLDSSLPGIYPSFLENPFFGQFIENPSFRLFLEDLLFGILLYPNCLSLSCPSLPYPPHMLSLLLSVLSFIFCAVDMEAWLTV